MFCGLSFSGGLVALHITFRLMAAVADFWIEYSQPKTQKAKPWLALTYKKAEDHGFVIGNFYL
jgi:hypothetical protein